MLEVEPSTSELTMKGAFCTLQIVIIFKLGFSSHSSRLFLAAKMQLYKFQCMSVRLPPKGSSMLLKVLKDCLA